DLARQECSSRLRPKSTEGAAEVRAAIRASRRSTRTKEAAVPNLKIARWAFLFQSVPTASVNRAAGRPRIKLNRSKCRFVVRNILLQQRHQRLGLLRAQINALKVT